MIRSSSILLAAAALGLALAVMACGGKKSSSEGTTITTVVGGQTVVATTSRGATSQGTPIPSDPQAVAEITKLYQDFSAVKSFRATLTIQEPSSGSQQGTMEFVAPDRVHMTVSGNPTGVTEIISIGADSYARTGSTWARSGGSGVIDPRSIAQPLENASKSATGVTRGGTATVEGKTCQLFSAVVSDNTSAEFCVVDGLPLRVISKVNNVTVTMLFSDYNAVINIIPPI